MASAMMQHVETVKETTENISEINEDQKTETTEITEATEELIEEEDEEPFFQDIYLLSEHQISAEDIELLKTNGLNTIKGIQMTTRSKLLELNGLNGEKVDKIKKACSQISLNNGFMTGLEVSEERKQVFKLKTGSSNLE